MANGIRLDLQEALARGPSGIPNLEPLFAPGAIPPVFDEAPEVEEGPGFIPGGGIPGVSTGTFTGEPIDLGSGSIGQPVPPVKASRGERLRRLLGNFLQNFGEGLQAASRAPSGAGFAAGFGAALSAPEERRQQQVRESLLRANQTLRQQIAAENAAFHQADLEAEERAREVRRIERQLDRAGTERKTFQDILRTGTRRAADFVAGRKQRAQAFEQKKELIRLQDKLAREREGLKPRKRPPFPQGERTNLAEAVASRVGNIQGSELIPGGGFRARLQISKIKAKIDRLFRAGLSPEEIANEFDLAIQGVKGTVTLKGVLDNLADEPVR
jgi:hypothetical protein